MGYAASRMLRGRTPSPRTVRSHWSSQEVRDSLSLSLLWMKRLNIGVVCNFSSRLDGICARTTRACSCLSNTNTLHQLMTCSLEEAQTQQRTNPSLNHKNGAIGFLCHMGFPSMGAQVCKRPFHHDSGRKSPHSPSNRDFL